MPDKTCAERIDEQKKSRFYDIALLAKDFDELDEHDNLQIREIFGLDNDFDEESFDSARWGYALGMHVARTVVIELSCGGPSDRIEIDVDSDGTPLRGEYVFLDWFDGARVTLSSDEIDMVCRVFPVDLALEGETH